MRLFTTIFTVLALSTLAGCASSATATRGSDTAVRAEVRRVSNARAYSVQKLVAGEMDPAERAQRAMSF